MNKSPLILPVIALALAACGTEPPGPAAVPPATIAAPPVQFDVPVSDPGGDFVGDVPDFCDESEPAGGDVDAPAPGEEPLPPMSVPGPLSSGPENLATPSSEGLECIPLPPQTEPEPLEAGTVALTVSNQSYEDPTVHLVIRIDGDVVVDEDFEVESQHNWKGFDVESLEPGEHTITAEADNGGSFEQVFTIPDGEGRYLILDYWGNPDNPDGRSFSFDEMDEPPMFA